MATKDKRQFIMDTLLPYKEDPSKCAIVGGKCKYLTEDGKKCAIGKHMKEGVWQYYTTPIFSFVDKLEDILTEEALAQNISLLEWVFIQKYHDFMTSNPIENMNKIVSILEDKTDLKFPELYF